MARLDYTLTNDTLFKMVFVKHPDLLKRLVAALLEIPFERIGRFEITNSEMPPESLGDKFCRLDINMMVGGDRVDLEVQVANEGDFPERSLYYWAREYSSSLDEGKPYLEIPRVVVISILGFKLFDCMEFHSDFQALEVRRHERLTDKLRLIYFELPKLPEPDGAGDELKLWLSLFKAETEGDLVRIEEMEAPVMHEAIEAYRRVAGSKEFKELERMRSLARHNEASALLNAEMREREKWQAEMAREKQESEAELARQKQEAEEEMAKEKRKSEAEMARQRQEAEEELARQKQEAEEELARQKQEAEEELARQKQEVEAARQKQEAEAARQKQESEILLKQIAELKARLGDGE